MKFSCVVLFMIVGIGTCTADIYTPCKLARELYRVIDDNKWDSLVDIIPLLVCVAGYHEYNTMSSLPAGYQGIFGILDAEISARANKFGYPYTSGYTYDADESYNLTKEVDVFVHQVLKIDYGYSYSHRHPNLRFYRRICSGSYVETETCSIALNPYVVSAFEVPVPIYPGLLINLRWDHDKLGSFDPFESDFQQPSWQWQMVFAVTTFWVVGIVLVGAAAFVHRYVQIRSIQPINM